MSILDDYLQHRYGRYFTRDFWEHHVRPGWTVFRGNHSETRDLVKRSNLALNWRLQEDRVRRELEKRKNPKKKPYRRLEHNSIILNVGENGEPRQILRLMKEVESRNQDKTYERAMKAAEDLETNDPYGIITTGLSSKHDFTYGSFLYGIEAIEGGRYLINHFAGFDEG